MHPTAPAQPPAPARPYPGGPPPYDPHDGAGRHARYDQPRDPGYDEPRYDEPRYDGPRYDGPRYDGAPHDPYALVQPPYQDQGQLHIPFPEHLRHLQDPAGGAPGGWRPAMTTADAFAAFEQAIRLSPAQRAVVEQRRSDVERALTVGFPPGSGMPLVAVTAIGAAGRDTIITPLDEVDILAFFSAARGAWQHFRWRSHRLLDYVSAALTGARVEPVGTRGRALRIIYDTPPDVHLVAAFGYSHGGYAMPDGNGGWLPTNPDRHAAWLAAAGPAATTATRILKYWNRQHDSRLRAFHAEVLAGTYGGRAPDSRQALDRVFAGCERRLAVPDPAGSTGDLSSYLAEDERDELRAAFRFARAHSGQAVLAEAGGDHEEAMSMWRIALGPDFPAYEG